MGIIWRKKIFLFSNFHILNCLIFYRNKADINYADIQNAKENKIQKKTKYRRTVLFD